MNSNIILMTDSYKASHWTQYTPGTESVYSYIEPRGGAWPNVLVFGLQAFIKQYLSKPITRADIEEAAAFFAAHGEPFHRDGWQYILDQHDGFLPVLISSVPEGSLIPVGEVIASIVNTDPQCFWLTSYLETALLRAVWYPSTVATNSFMCKVAILAALNRSSDDPAGQIGFKLHDFGARGVSSAESAALGGMAHLVNFQGSDTIEGILAARRYYLEPMAGFSIPAAEHATITSWGEAHEIDAYRNMLRQFATPGGIVAVVSDSYDLMHAVRDIWGDVLRQEVIDSGATIVIRPDSGDPETVPVEVIRTLAERFGSTVNRKGYQVLPACVRVIQGDGITLRSLHRILANLLAAGFSADNLAFGMGGGLLQQVDRDTMKWAMKCSAIQVNTVWQDVCKHPLGDPSKHSKSGRLALAVSDFGEVFTTRHDAVDRSADLLRPVFCNGQQIGHQSFALIRERAHRMAVVMAGEAARG